MTDLPFYEPTGNEIALFEHAYRQRLPLLIKGPTGCGKTRFVAHMAARLHFTEPKSFPLLREVCLTVL